MAARRRNAQETVAILKDELAEKDEYIDELEDKLDRMTGRLARAHSITDLEDIEDSDEDEDEDVDVDEDEDEDDDE